MIVIPASAALLAAYVRTPEGEWPIAEAIGWTLEMIEEAWAGPGTQVCIRARWQGTTPTRGGLMVRRRLDAVPQRVLVPGVFYGDNGLGNRSTRYPRLGPLDSEAFTAPGWDFAAERTPLPAVFAWVAGGVSWLAVEPHGTGIGFSLGEDSAELRAHSPGVERPFRHDRLDESPFLPLTEVAPGAALEIRVWYGKEPPAPNAVAAVQRALQTAWGGADA